MAHEPQLDDDALRQAVADNHRDWMARWAVAEGGGVVPVDGAELYLSGEANLFPATAPDPDALLAAIRAHDCAGVGYWSLGADDRLGVRLVARGFGWGWRPHWMAIDLEDEERFALAPDPGFEVVVAPGPPYAHTLPYAPSNGVEDPPGVFRLGVRLREKVIGQISINPTGAVAGIYAMGVAPRVRGRGIATALTHGRVPAGDPAWLPVCRPERDRRGRARLPPSRLSLARLGSDVVVLPATGADGAGDRADRGDRVRRPRGARGAVAHRRGARRFAARRRVAAHVRAADRAGAGCRVDPGSAAGARRARYGRTRTLLHLAVEQGSAPFVELALAHGVDVTARDPRSRRPRWGGPSTSGATRWRRGCATRACRRERGWG